MTEEKNYMLIQNDCDACNNAKELLKDAIEKKEIVLLNIDTEKGFEMAVKNEIEAIPIIINDKDDFQQKCYLNKDASLMWCDDGSEKELIKNKEEK